MVGKWIPLESNPDLFNLWSEKMGLNLFDYRFHDIYGMDEELLSLVPRPVEAVLFLFRLTEENERLSREEEVEEEGGRLIWFKQLIGNACGTIALLHSILNSKASSSILPGSPLEKLLEESKLLKDGQARGELLCGSEALEKVHQEIARLGEKEEEEDVDLHFVCFVRGGEEGDLIYLLDGRRKGPLLVVRSKEGGDPTKKGFLEETIDFVRKRYMEINPDEINFNLIALVGGQSS
ncbi:cysteine proteinase [Violaceomyces palustris]|uniref:Cysteine proteinase n=1 Tax=Violaceomyces palustris TaxID=1673888 RepID=A0ACD0P0L1_9BASI|nr:cysteine proteinase [Violaceomyces palustris]